MFYLLFKNNYIKYQENIVSMNEFASLMEERIERKYKGSGSVQTWLVNLHIFLGQNWLLIVYIAEYLNFHCT